MWSQQIFVALLSTCLALQHVAAVVNNGQTKAVDESEKNSAAENKENEKKPDATDLVAESSETANRREAPAISDTYGAPSLGSSLPVPVYGVPNIPSNNFVYPAPPPDIPPPPPKVPSSLYGPPTLGNTYGVPQVNPFPSKGYGPPLPVKYGAPSLSFNQFSNYLPPKPVYGPPKHSYGVPNKPIKFHKFPSTNFGLRPPKPIYGPPAYKDNFNFNKFNFKGNLNSNNFNNLYTNSLLNTFSTNSHSNLYSGVSSLNHQYGAPILPPKPTLSVQYGVPNTGLSSQYGVPDKIFSGPEVGYGPPQPSSNPKPPHPGAPAPPTPPDIKYDGWQPIPGLVSKRPEEIQHVTGDASGYHDLSPPPLSGGGQVSSSYGAPPVTLDLSHGPSVLEQPGGLSDSYGVPLNSVTGSKGLSDSYGAPLGTVTGSGGIVSSSGDEAHNAGSSSHSSSSHSLSLDLSSIGFGQEADIQAIKSVEYNISPQGSNAGTSLQLSNLYGAPQASGYFSNGHNFNSFGSSSQSFKGGLSSSSDAAAIGLVPPSGNYGAPPNSQYGTSLHTNGYKGSKASSFSSGKGFGNSYLSHGAPINSYGIPNNNAISFQNVAHGSSTAGLNIQQSSLHTDGASSLPLTSYNVPLGTVDGSYTLPAAGGGDIVALDYSHPPVSIDLTEEKTSTGLDCYNKQQLQVPSLAYGVPSADSYTSSLSSLTTNIANSQVAHSSYGTSQQPQITLQYGLPDLAHSSSIKSESKANSIIESSEEAHGKDYGKSVAASFGPSSELVESQSIDLNNIPLQGNLGSYTLQIQSADGGTGQVSHNQVLNEGLLQSILQAIEQPGKQGQNAQYPIILQPSVERTNYLVNQTINNLGESHEQASEIREVRVEAPKGNNIEEEQAEEKTDDEETLQLLDTSNIALYYKKDGDMKRVDINEEPEENSLDSESN